MSSNAKCCLVDKVFGYTLKQGVDFVGIATLAISAIALITSLIVLSGMASKEKHYNSDSVKAIDMIFALFSTSTSLYQITISVMMMSFTMWNKGVPFMLTLWYASQLSILPLYCFMFTARVIVTFNAGYTVSALLTACMAIIYKGVFIYFSIIVNSYINSLDPTIFYS